MSRTLSAPLLTHLAGNAHTRCRMLLFLLRDGTAIGITDHDEDIPFSLPEEPLVGSVTYLASTGFRISDVEHRINLEPGNYEVSGPVGLVATLPALLGGRWRRATVYLFEVNWKSPDAAIDMMKGQVCLVHVDAGEFKFEIRDGRDLLNQVCGRTLTNQCQRKHAACCVNIAPEVDTTVATVTDGLTIEVAAAITSTNFIGGKIWFTTGDLAGTDPTEIFGVTGSVLTLFEPLPALPTVGDELTLKEGCDGTREMCRDRFNNVIEHRGFPEIPGSDQVLRAAIPGEGDQ